MKTYAYIVDGLVYQLIPPVAWDIDVFSDDGQVLHHAGDEVALSDRYTPEFVNQCVEVPDGLDVQQQWTYDGSVFAAPVPYAPLPAEILAANTGIRDALLTTATAAIAPLQDAVDLDMATDSDTASLKAWKTYRVLVNRVDLTLAEPVWPASPAQ